MPELRPFTGLLFDPDAGPLETLTAPPYDVVSPEQRDRLHQLSPHNVVRLILPRDDADEGPMAKYTRADERLRAWRRRGILRPTAAPAVYPYEIAFEAQGVRRAIRGVIAEVDLGGAGAAIVPHERTMPGPVEDRLALLRAVRANLSPIYVVFVGGAAALSSLLDGAMSEPPARETRDEAGARHRLWVVADGVDAALASVSVHPLLIADGHHRYTVARAFREEMRAHAGAGPWDAMMMFIVDATTEAPPVLPIHRLLVSGAVPDLAGGEPAATVAALAGSLDDDGLTFGLIVRREGRVERSVHRLDPPGPTVCALHEQVLDRIGDARIDFVSDVTRADAAVGSGEARAAFVLPQTRVERVWEVVRDGRTLPQKSTYFWPKPRTGMVIRPMNP